MTDQMTAVQYGVGPIGSRIVRAGHQQGIEFVGAIDIDPQKLGRDLGDVAGCNESLDVTVTDDASAVLGPDIDMVFHSTVSSLQMAMPQLRECLEAGVDVISTCEQLTFPQYRHPDLATELDQVATTNEVSIMGTGINPGYAMDFLPTVLTIPCHTVKSIEVLRVQNASTRREPAKEGRCGVEPRGLRRANRRPRGACWAHRKRGDDRACVGVDTRRDHRRR